MAEHYVDPAGHNVYVHWNAERLGFPELQDGDIIINGNYWQKTQRVVPQDLTLIDSPNMTRCLLTGTITADSHYPNNQDDICYWVHIRYDEDGNVLNPLNLDEEEPECRHCDPSLIEEIETEEGTIKDFSNSRADRPQGWTPDGE